MSTRHSLADRLTALDPRLIAVAAVLGLLAGTLLLQAVAQVGVVAFASAGLDRSLTDPAVIVLLIVAGDVVLLAVALTYARRRLDGLHYAALTRTDAVWVVGALAVKFGLYGLSRLVTDWLGVQDPPDVLVQGATADPRLLLVVAVLSLLTIGPAEEAFFRGAIQGRLRRAYSPIAAVVGAATLFAAPHMLNYVLGNANPLAPGAVVAVTTVFATGAVMGYAYERTGNLLVPILLHGLYDATLFLAVYLGLLSF